MPLQENRLILSRYLICLGTCFNILEPKSVCFYLPLTIFVLLELWRKVSIQNKQWKKRSALNHSCLPVQEDWHLVLSFTHFAANPAVASSWSASIEISSSFFVFRPAWEEIWGLRCHRYKYRYMQTCFRIGVLLLAGVITPDAGVVFSSEIDNVLDFFADLSEASVFDIWLMPSVGKFATKVLSEQSGDSSTKIFKFYAYLCSKRRPFCLEEGNCFSLLYQQE